MPLLRFQFNNIYNDCPIYIPTFVYCKTLNKSNLSTNQYLLSFRFSVSINHTYTYGYCLRHLLYSLERHRRRTESEKLLTYHVFPMSLPMYRLYAGTYKGRLFALDCKKKSNRRTRRRMDIVQMYVCRRCENPFLLSIVVCTYVCRCNTEGTKKCT